MSHTHLHSQIFTDTVQVKYLTQKGTRLSLTFHQLAEKPRF
uniref:Uncharacterized protein n=1 Tax=Anguilla anguilla TaxID=7936 RepID=A0A0E9RCB1_ANGAN